MSVIFLLTLAIELAIPMPPEAPQLPSSPRRDSLIERLGPRPTKPGTRLDTLIEETDRKLVNLYAKFDQIEREFADSVVRQQGKIMSIEKKVSDLRAIGDLDNAKGWERAAKVLKNLRTKLIETAEPEQQIGSDLAALANRTTFSEEYLSQAARKASAARSSGNEAEALRHERLARQYKVIDARYLNKIFAMVNRDVALCNALLKASDDGEPRVNRKHCEELSRKLEEALSDLKQQATHSVEYQDWMLKLTLRRTLRLKLHPLRI